MTQVDMTLVKELRARTQAKLNDCRTAAINSGGNLDAAVEYLQKKGLADSIKRSHAEASEGVVRAAVSIFSRSGIILEVNTQTDFAARSPDFLAFVYDYTQALLSGAPLHALEDARVALAAKLGENIVIRRWHSLSRADGEVVAYNHPGDKIAVLVEAEQSSSVLQDVAMQVAAMSPLYLSSQSVPHVADYDQKNIIMAQLVEDGKLPEPEWALVLENPTLQRIVEGKMAKWHKEVCLLEQLSVIESKKTVRQVLQAAGVDPEKISFTRFERGEGAEKVTKGDFASEVAALTQN